MTHANAETGWNYRKLQAWQRAMDLAQAVYDVSRGWPREELYGLTSQIRRAAVSVPSNIAEGQGRGWNKEFLHHLRIARASLLEVETQIVLAQRFGYVVPSTLEQVLAVTDTTSRLITGLMNRLMEDLHLGVHELREDPPLDGYLATDEDPYDSSD